VLAHRDRHGLTMTADGLELLEAALDLTEIGPDTFEGPGDLDNEYGIFGGHLLGQGVIAAGRTVAADRPIHSLHAYFVSGAAASGDLTYRVERVRDGGTFSHREVKAERDGRELFRLVASFHGKEPGPEFEAEPTGLPDGPGPSEVPSLPELLDQASEPVFDDYWNNRPRAFDLHYVHAPWAQDGPDDDAGIRVWWRTPRPLGDDPLIHAAAAAFMADESISDNILTPHGYTWTDEGLMVVSLDHAMWFHRPFRVDDWLLFTQRPLATFGARGLAIGEIRDAAGRLVATATQEALLRTPGPST